MTWLEGKRMMVDEDWLFSALRDGIPVFQHKYCVLASDLWHPKI